MTVVEAYNKIKNELTGVGIEDAEAEARIIMRETARINSTALHTHPDMELDRDTVRDITDVINRRLMREPLQYIYGRWSFMGLDFCVEPNVLIPRPDTEILVETVLKELHDGMRILDLCTGTGCVLISLLKYSNGCAGTGTDISPYAIELAVKNAALILGDGDSMPQNGAGVTFVRGDLYEAISSNGQNAPSYDVIVSNPPYIPSSVIGTLEPEVKDHEPALALDGGKDGLDIIKRIINGASKYLVRGGILCMETGHDQGASVSELMNAAGFVNTEVIKDYMGHERVVCARRPIL